MRRRLRLGDAVLITLILPLLGALPCLSVRLPIGNLAFLSGQASGILGLVMILLAAAVSLRLPGDEQPLPLLSRKATPETFLCLVAHRRKCLGRVSS